MSYSADPFCAVVEGGVLRICRFRHVLSFFHEVNNVRNCQ